MCILWLHTFNNNVSVGGNLVIAGQFSPAALSVTGTVNATKISATNATFNSVVSAGFFVGDGSGLINVPSVEGGTVKAIVNRDFKENYKLLPRLLRCTHYNMICIYDG